MNSRRGLLRQPASRGVAEGLTFWDQINISRWGRYLMETEEKAIRKAHELAGPPSAAIDLGCGSGNWSAYLSRLNWGVTSIDVDPASLQICQKKTPAARCVLTERSARAIPCASDSARLLLCIEVPVVEAGWFAAEAHRVLEGGGLAVGVFWNRRSWRRLAWALKQSLSGRPEKDYYYKSSYSTWRKQLQAAGFEFLHEEGFCWPPINRGGNSFLIPFFAKLEGLLGLRRWPTLSPWIMFIARKKAGQGPAPLPAAPGDAGIEF